MIKSRDEMDTEIKIDLSGPQGNAFVLMGIAAQICKAQGKTKEESDRIREDMKSSDYDHLIEVMEREFGDVVTMYR